MMKKSTDTLTIECVRIQGGGLCVLMPWGRVEALAAGQRRHEEAAAAILKEAGHEEAGERASDLFVRTHRDVRESVKDRIETRRYPWRTYTHGEKLECKRAATTAYTFEGEEKFKFDEDEYVLRIIATCLGITREDAADIEPPIFDAIVDEIFGRVSVAPERLSFFDYSPID